MIAPGFVREGQPYWAVRTFDYVRKSDGVTTSLTTWRSFCADCGTPFQTTVSTRDGRGPENRRCPDHKSPGKRVARSHIVAMRDRLRAAKRL